MSRCRVVLLFVLLLSGPALAGSADRDLPKPDPKGHWRVIGQDDATTTSTCVGDLSTPLCAMETYMASVVRRDSRAYNKSALLLPGEEKKFRPSEHHRKEWMKYRILSAEVLTEKQIPPPFLSCHVPDGTNCTVIPSAWRPGDVRIKITSRECRERTCRREEGPDRGSVLRRVDDEWKMVLMRPFVSRVDDIDGTPYERR